MEEEKKVKKSKKMRKLEEKIAKLTEKNNVTPKKSIEKKIMKLEKKKLKLEKWLKIKLPFRFLTKTGVTWLVIGGVCYGCTYVPVVREIKMTAMAAISYVAPEPVAKALDVVTLNVGTNKDDFEWIKNTLLSYINEEVKIETVNSGTTGRYSSDGMSNKYYLNGKEVSEAEYKKYQADSIKKGKEQQKEVEQLAKEVFGTASEDELTSMSITEILMKVATNSTPEIVSKVLDMSNLTKESRQRVEQDINRALKIIPKLNNNQMNELIEIINNKIEAGNKELYEKSLEAQEQYKQQIENEQKQMEQIQQQIQQMQQTNK